MFWSIIGSRCLIYWREGRGASSGPVSTFYTFMLQLRQSAHSFSLGDGVLFTAGKGGWHYKKGISCEIRDLQVKKKIHLHISVWYLQLLVLIYFTIQFRHESLWTLMLFFKQHFGPFCEQLTCEIVHFLIRNSLSLWLFSWYFSFLPDCLLYFISLLFGHQISPVA